jgi:hypothetical protein
MEDTANPKEIPKSRSVTGAAQKLVFLKTEYFWEFGHWRL